MISVDWSVLLILDGTLLCCGNSRSDIFANCSVMLQFVVHCSVECFPVDCYPDAWLYTTLLNDFGWLLCFTDSWCYAALLWNNRGRLLLCSLNNTVFCFCSFSDGLTIFNGSCGKFTHVCTSVWWWWWFRNNKLGLDEINSEGVLERLVEEVHMFAPITSAPINTLQVQGVAVGTSHAALLTGNYSLYIH